jgi:hypothetical protein
MRNRRVGSLKFVVIKEGGKLLGFSILGTTFVKNEYPLAVLQCLLPAELTLVPLGHCSCPAIQEQQLLCLTVPLVPSLMKVIRLTQIGRGSKFTSVPSYRPIDAYVWRTDMEG